MTRFSFFFSVTLALLVGASAVPAWAQQFPQYKDLVSMGLSTAGKSLDSLQCANSKNIPVPPEEFPEVWGFNSGELSSVVWVETIDGKLVHVSGSL